MNINDSFPSNYLKASDLGTNQPVVTIAHIKQEPVGRDKEMKAVVYFQGKEKGVVLNKTNAKKIIEIAGTPETDDWPGVRVRLFASTTEFAGDMVECIRIKAPGNARSQAAPPPPPEPEERYPMADDSDIPFAWILPFVFPMTALFAAGMFFV